MSEVEIPKVGRITVDTVVDCSGMVCPRPQLEVKKAAIHLKSGEVAEVILTNPASAETVPRILQNTECILLGYIKEQGTFKLYFRKK